MVSLAAHLSVIVVALVDTRPDGVWTEAVIADQALYAPEVVRVEVTDVFRRLEATERITAAEASGAQEDLSQLELEEFPFEPLSVRV